MNNRDRESYSERIARMKIRTCGCGRKLRTNQLQCDECLADRDKEVIEAEGD